jgi:hypothetical protein
MMMCFPDKNRPINPFQTFQRINFQSLPLIDKPMSIENMGSPMAAGDQVDEKNSSAAKNARPSSVPDSATPCSQAVSGMQAHGSGNKGLSPATR